MRAATGVGLIIWALCFSVGLFAQDEREPDREALRELKALFEKAAAENQLDPLKEHLHEPFSVVTYTDREFTDFEAFKARWNKTRAEVVGEGGSYKVTLKPEPTEFFGDIAVARGDSDNELVTASGTKYEFTSHWTIVLRKVDGNWKIVRVHSSIDPFGNPMVVGEVSKKLMQVGIAAAVGGLLVGAAIAWLVFGRRAPSAARPASPASESP
jgi:ketosteroid isomerase-like protein